MTGQLDPRFTLRFRATWETTQSSHAIPLSTLSALGLTQGDFLDVIAWIFLVSRKLHFENGERAAFKAGEALTALFVDQRCFLMVQDALSCVQKEDVPQILATCCLKLTAQFESQNNDANYDDFLKMMNLEDSCSPNALAWLETTIFACLSSTESFSFSQATALDILDFLHLAAPEYLAGEPYAIQKDLILDRETCSGLLAFLHCNSLIDCRLLALSVFIFSYRRQPLMLRAALRDFLVTLLGSDVVNLAEPILAALRPRLLDDMNDPRLLLRAYLVGIHGRTNESSMNKIRTYLDLSS